MTYQITIKRTAAKALADLQADERQRITQALFALADNPRPAGVKKLKGREGWRIRIGQYRVLYTIDDDRLIVLVVNVGHRREIYR